MILDIYKDSFEFSSRKVLNLIILGLLSLFNILIIPLVFFYGYNYRVVKLSTQSMINGDDVPPDFDDFKKMFVDGLKYIVVEFVYLISTQHKLGSSQPFRFSDRHPPQTPPFVVGSPFFY